MRGNASGVSLALPGIGKPGADKMLIMMNPVLTGSGEQFIIIKNCHTKFPFMSRAFLFHKPNRLLGKAFQVAVTALAFWQIPTGGQAAVTAGGIAILGFTDNHDVNDDSFSIATLENIAAGTTIYFTDNGWSSVNGFYGASNTNGNGNEELIKLTFTSNVYGGTILRSGYNTAAATWDITSIIPGASNGDSYYLLNLPSSGAGDQIYAFEAGGDPPLVNPTNHIFLLDLGDVGGNAGFEDVSSPATGNIAPGLSTVANTAVSLPDPASGDDPNDFHNGSFALNMADADVIALNSSGGTKAQWLALIADSANWVRSNYNSLTNNTPDVEAQLSTLNILGAPEPSRALLLALGSCLMVARRRRQV